MACPVCFSSAFIGVSLSNGEILHSSCLQRITDALADANLARSLQRIQVASLRKQLTRQETYLGKVVRFFGRGADLETLRSRVAAAEASTQLAEGACESAKAKATPVFDVMLDYPPDWPLRSAAVVARDKVCTSCGSGKTLQAHHVVPLSKGGTNRLGNLKLLCEQCHQRMHGGKEFSSNKSVEPLAIADRVQLLRNAIASGAKVEFMYKKPTDTSHQKRQVAPRSLVEIAHKHDAEKSLCLRGYCYLRCAERTFALKRMKGLKLITR